MLDMLLKCTEKPESIPCGMHFIKIQSGARKKARYSK